MSLMSPVLFFESPRSTSKKNTIFLPFFCIVFLGLMVIPVSALPENPAILHQYMFGGSKFDMAMSVQQTGEGGYIFCGYTQSENLPGYHGGEADGFVVKLNTDAGTEWSRCYGGRYYEEFDSIQETFDGGYILAGWTRSPDGDLADDFPGYEPDKELTNQWIWIVKLDSEGNIQWDEVLWTSGITPEDHGFTLSVLQALDGSFLITSGEVGSDHWSYAHIYTLGRDGKLLKHTSIGPQGMNPTSIKQTRDGGYIVSGSTGKCSTGADCEDADAILIKLDPNFNQQWIDSPRRENSDEYFYSVEQTLDSGYIAVGKICPYDPYDRTVLVRRYDSTLSLVWEKIYQGSGIMEDVAVSVAQSPDGKYIIGGYADSNDGDFGGNHGGWDGWVAKLGEGGTIIWQKSIGGSAHERFFSMTLTQDNHILLAGESRSNDGDLGWTIPGGDDAWLVWLETEPPSIEKIIPSPYVPVTGKTLSLMAYGNASLDWEITGMKWELYDKEGKLIDEKGSSVEYINPYTYINPEGAYGIKKAVCTVYAKFLPSGYTYICDTETFRFGIFFPIVNYPATDSWWKDGYGDIVIVPDYSIDLKDNPNKEPNWFLYWKKDEVISGIKDFQYTTKAVRGQYSPSTKTLFLGLGAPTYKSLKFIINSSGGIESFGGLKYLDSVENTIGHELRHKLIYDTWPTLTAASDFDGDWVPNDFENGTLTTAWEPQGSKTIWTNSDTYNLANVYNHPDYRSYGDNEYLARRGGEQAKGNLKNDKKDWSNEGALATNQKDALTDSFGPEPDVLSTDNDFGKNSLSILSDGGHFPGLSGFEGVLSERGVDQNGNGLFEKLEVTVGINVNASSLYYIDAWLIDNDGNTVATSYNGKYLASGTYPIALNFSGFEIYSSGLNGPYNLSIVLNGGGDDWDLLELARNESAYTTNTYSISQFEGAQFAQPFVYYDTGIDKNDDDIYEFLQVNLTCTLNQPGTYTISASLYKGDEFITSASTEANLALGEQTIGFNFDGPTIASHEKNGPFTLRELVIADDKGTALNYTPLAFTTSPYLYSQFISSAISVQSITEEGSDFNNDGLYDFLTLHLTLDVNAPDSYTFFSWLVDPDGNEITGLREVQHLEPGNQQISLNFDGHAINHHRVNGSYLVSPLTVYDHNGTVVACKAPAIGTRAYQYTQFQGLALNLTGSHSDEGYDADSNGRYDALRVRFGVIPDNSGRFVAGAWLKGPDGALVEYAGQNGTFSANETREITLVFDGTKIYESGQSGEFSVAALSIHDPDTGNSFFQEEAFDTTSYTYTLFEQPGFVTGTITSTSGTPLRYVNVYIEDQDFTVTNPEGRYRLRVHPGGTYEVFVRPPEEYNLTPTSAMVEVTPGSTTIQDFVLDSNVTSPPIVQTITPSSGYPDTSVPFTIRGSHFSGGSTVLVNRTGEVNHSAAVNRIEWGEIQGTLNLAGVNPGLWNIMVITLDGKQGILENGFRVFNLSIPQPEANFSANVTSGTARLTVQFTDTSTGNPLSWLWDFDDNTTSQEQNPVHIFTDQGAAPGETKQFVVELRIENEGGYATSSQIISVTAPSVSPVANFTPFQRSGSAPLSVQFTDTSQQGPTSWYWDFGDGSNATVQNPMHIYTTAGNYTVSLTAANSAGSDTITRVDCINVTWHAPEISYISPEKGGQGSDINIYISGMYFRAGAIAGLERESAVIPITITDIDPYGLYGTLIIPSDAALGDWNVTVRQDGLVSNRNVVFQVVTPVPAEPGWMFRADERHSGKYPDGSKIPNNLLNWSFETGGPVRSSPVVVNGIVYFGSNDGKVYALNAVNGTEKWSFSTGGEVRSTPAVVNNRVFFGSSEGTVYALNAATGSPLWNVTTGDPVRSSPLVIDNVVYIGSDDGKLYALNATTGSTRWSYQTGGPVLSSPAFNMTYLDWIFVGSDDGYLYVFNAENGNVISTSYPSTGGAVRSSPSVRRDMSQYCGSDDGWIWETMGTEGMRPAFFLGSPIQSSPAVFSVPDPVFPDRLVVGCDDGNISMFRLYPPFGPLPVPIWKYPTGGPVRSSPAVAHNTIFIGSNDGSVHAINASTGLGVWTFATGGPVASSPAVANGMVFVGSDDGTLYAIGNDTQEFPAPIVISITPDSGVADTVVPITTLAGLHFQEHARVNLTRTGGPTVTMTNVVVHPDGTSISGDLNLAGVPEGLWDIVVTNPDGKSGSLHESFTVRAPSELIASFVADPLSGKAPLTVQFNDTSVGNPTAWNWSFGEGSWFNTTNATSRNVSKTYLAPGSYTVQLRVSNSGGSNTSLPGTTITVTEPPVAPTAAFSMTINHLSVNFTDQSSGTPPLTYAWDFGDGATTSETSPTHIYSSAGTYPVILTVTNSAGSDNETQSVTVTQENASITLLNPNGGERWQQGSIQTLRWNFAGDPGTHVKIEALRGTHVLATVTSSYPIGLDGSGSYNLTFPYGTPLGSDYFIRVTSTSNATYTDTSDTPFSIIPPITVVSPNGGEDWQQGTTHTIRWDYIGNPGSTVKIEALRGDTILAVISPGAPAGPGGTGSMNLTLPINAPVGTEYRIRISSTSNVIYTDTSDAPFRISANTGSSIELVAPNGGENWVQGSNQTIQWNYTGNPGTTVKIEALRNGTVLAVITPGTSIGPSGSGSFNLTFPYNTPLGSDYRIRVTSTKNPAWTDTSDDTFSVSPAITVTSPDGGEHYPVNSILPMSWTYSGNPGSTVNIQVIKNTTVLKTLTGIPIGTSGSGLLNVTIPGSTPNGSDYLIRVSSTSYPACFDTSNGTFTISGT